MVFPPLISRGEPRPTEGQPACQADQRFRPAKMAYFGTLEQLAGAPVGGLIHGAGKNSRLSRREARSGRNRTGTANCLSFEPAVRISDDYACVDEPGVEVRVVPFDGKARRARPTRTAKTGPRRLSTNSAGRRAFIVASSRLHRRRTGRVTRLV